jgi:DNA (cytosine-5)-methyltransferase 1
VYQQLEKIGYNVFDITLSPMDLGIPQNRERVIFIVIRKDLYTKEIETTFRQVLETKKLEYQRDARKDILETNPDPKYNVSPEISAVLKSWDEFIHLFTGSAIISPVIPEYFTENTSSENPDWKNEYITKNRTFYQKHQSILDPWYQRNKDVLTKRSIYGKLEWQTGTVGAIKPTETIYDYFVQIRQSGVRVKKTDCFPALVAIVQTPIVARQERYLTPRECARLQSFPDTFSFGDQNDKLTYKQLGNGVNVDMIRLVAETLTEVFKL